MAARANPFFELATPDTFADDIRARPENAVARLAILHAEAEETARLANLLARLPKGETP